MRDFKLTKAIRRQIYTTDLIYSTSIVFELGKDVQPKTKNVLKRINARLENINQILYGGSREKLVDALDTKSQRNYFKTIEKIKQVLIVSWEGDKVEADFFNAILYIVENVRQSAKKSNNKQLLHEWSMLNQSLNTLFCHIVEEPEGNEQLNTPNDPKKYYHRITDFIGYKYQDLGVVMGQRFEKVLAA